MPAIHVARIVRPKNQFNIEFSRHNPSAMRRKSEVFEKSLKDFHLAGVYPIERLDVN